MTPEELERRLAVMEHSLDVLQRQTKALRRQLQLQAELLDTISSPLYKRVWFFLCGWNWSSLGRWYNKKLWTDSLPPAEPDEFR